MRRIFLLSQTILLFTFFNIAFIISVFLHALGFEKHGNPYVVVLSHTSLKHRGYADLIGGTLPPAALTINEIVSLSLAILPRRHPFSCFLGFYSEVFDKNTLPPISSVFQTFCA